jgi:hypothetical protein
MQRAEAVWQHGRVSEPTPGSVAARTHRSNLGQLDIWDGDGGAFWADQADRFDAGVARYHEHFLAASAMEQTASFLTVPLSGLGHKRVCS